MGLKTKEKKIIQFCEVLKNDESQKSRIKHKTKTNKKQKIKSFFSKIEFHRMNVFSNSSTVVKFKKKILKRSRNDVEKHHQSKDIKK